MIELSRYTLEALRKDEEFILYRGRSQGDASGVLVLSPVLQGSGANFKKGRLADPGALGERESLACQIGPKFKLCTRSVPDIVPDIDDTPATAVLPEVEKYRPKGLPSTNPELDDDDDGWRLVPYFGILLVFFSWIVQSGLGAIKRKAARLKFEPNALRSTGSVNGPRRPTLEDRFKPSGTRPPALDKLAAAFSTAGERQQKAPDEKTRASLEHFSGDPDVEKARAKSEHTQEIEETFHKDFDGIGLG